MQELHNVINVVYDNMAETSQYDVNMPEYV